MKVYRIKFDSYNSQKNFPARSARKQGEANFLRAFEQVYYCQFQRNNYNISGYEFAVQSFGRADLVWMTWNPSFALNDTSMHALRQHLRRRKLIAFEAKLKDWQKALQQAFRYRYFADKVIVVMPHSTILPALANLESFHLLKVGLWSFNEKTGIIREYYSPNQSKALNKEARELALDLIIRKIDLRKVQKNVDSIVKLV